VGWLVLVSNPPSAPSPFELAPRGPEGESPKMPLARRRPGPGGARGNAPPASDAWGKRGSGVYFLSRGHAPGFACTRRSWRACQPVGSAARHPARAGAVGPAARPPGLAGWRGWSKRRGKKGEERGKKGAGDRGPHGREREEVRGAVRLSGPKCTLGLGRCNARRIDFSPITLAALILFTD
jgi:hypothetical protein